MGDVRLESRDFIGVSLCRYGAFCELGCEVAIAGKGSCEGGRLRPLDTAEITEVSAPIGGCRPATFGWRRSQRN